MGARKLGSFTQIPDGDGVLHDFGPADDLPEWAEEFLDNAAKDANIERHPAFAVEPEPDDDEAEGKPQSKRAAGRRKDA